MMNLKEMSIEKLKELQKMIGEELQTRFIKKVIYVHPCKGSAKHHMRKYKHWSKKLVAIDDTKTNGYAYEGDFLKVDSQNLVSEGDFVIEYSGCGCGFKLVKVVGDEKTEELATGTHGNMIDFLREVKDLTGLC